MTQVLLNWHIYSRSNIPSIFFVTILFITTFSLLLIVVAALIIFVIFFLLLDLFYKTWRIAAFTFHWILAGGANLDSPLNPWVNRTVSLKVALDDLTVHLSKNIVLPGKDCVTWIE